MELSLQKEIANTDFNDITSGSLPVNSVAVVVFVLVAIVLIVMFAGKKKTGLPMQGRSEVYDWGDNTNVYNRKEI